VSTRGVDHTERFSEITAAIARRPAPTLILDGGVAVFDEALISHMHLLMDPPGGHIVTPPVLTALRLLFHTRGRDLRPWPLRDRRKVMEDEIEGLPILPARD
jgi:ATP-dependent DNA ligase